MPDILFPFLKKHKVDFNLEEKIFLLVANRLHDPKQEHGMARWLEKMYAFYRDLTSTYFAQREPKGDIKRHGHSRDEEKLLKEKQIEGTYIL